MATRIERTAAYGQVITALRKVALMDSYMERVAIANAMDALGPILSDTAPALVAQAIRFRNGPLLRCRQPVNTYLQRDDPKPVKWVFTTAEVLDLIRNSMDYSIAHRSIGPALVREAYRKISEHTVTALIGFNEDAWCATVNADGSGFHVTLYPSVDHPYLPTDALRYMNPGRPQPKTPPGRLPTILVEYDWVLGILDPEETVELTIIYYAHAMLKDRKPEKFAKLTMDWWAKVEATDIGYLVTFHYDKEMP